MRTLSLSFRPALCALALAAIGMAPLHAQTRGNVFPPTLSYAPAPNTAINFSGVTVAGSNGSAQITITASGGMGSGGFATMGLNCTYTGPDAGSFSVTPSSQSILPGSPQRTLNLGCTSGFGARNATLVCSESPGGSTGQVRNWPVTCPAGDPPRAPDLSYLPAENSTVTFTSGNPVVGNQATATIRVTPSGGLGSGADSTAEFKNCSVTGETVPATFGGFQGTVFTFVGTTTTPRTLNLTAVLRASPVTATLRCDEVRPYGGLRGTAVIPRTWVLQSPAGEQPTRLTLDKSASAAQVTTDSVFRYTITVGNDGSSSATGLIVLDKVPAGLTVISAAGDGWNCGVTGNTVDCRRNTLLPRASSSFEIEVRAPASPRSLVNTARVTARGSDTPIVASVAVDVVPPPQAPIDLEIAKSDSADPVLAGALFSYQLEVRNLGSGAATGVRVNDPLPTGVSVVSVSGEGWTCSSAATVDCSLNGPLAGGASAARIVVQVRAPTHAGSITNRASVSANEVDSSSANNADSESTVITAEPPPPPEPRADLGVSAVAAPASARTGGAVEFQVQVANAGPDVAAAPRLTGALGAPFELLGASGAGWTCQVAGQTVDCLRNTGLAASQSAELRVQTRIRPGASAAADARFTASSATADPVSGNNQANVVVPYQPGGADLAIVKTDSADPVTAAAQFSYTLTVSNAGPESASGVRISDSLPAALAFVSASGNGFSCARNGQTVECVLGGSLAAGASAAATIVVRAPTSGQTLSNEGIVSSTTIDLNPTNNRSTQQTRINDRTAEDLADLLDNSVVDMASGSSVPVLSDECADPSTALADTCEALIDAADDGRTGEVSEALREISPDEVLAQTLVLREIAATQFFNVDARLNELRRGSGGFSLSGLTVTSGSQTIPLALVGDALQEALGFGESDGGLASPWGFFINGNLGSGEQDENLGEGRVGVDYDSRGITAGVDYRLSNRAVIGGAIGYANYDSDVNGDGQLDAKSLLFTGYGSYYVNDRFYIDSRLTYGNSSLDQTRRIDFQLGPDRFSATATGDTDASQFTLATSIGYHLNYGTWSVTPNAGLRYTRNDVDAFEESGAGVYNVGYDEQSFDTLQFALGVSVARAISLSSGVLMPQFDLSLNNENSDDAAAEAYLVNGSTSNLFILREENPDQSYGAAGLGFVYMMGNGRQAFMSYRHTFGNDDFDRGTLNLGGRFEF
jgi:outer membrane autotransporter protein/uncharacterized repeat protein (TIGR01451 family)